jgi:hypothetical protein
MALLFPISASIGQTYQSGSSNTYEWTGTYWKIKNVINFNEFSASVDLRIRQTTNEQDLSYLATTGSNTFNGNQTINGSIILDNGAVIKDTPNNGISFGYLAGDINQSTQSVAIGNGAGYQNQSNQGIAIGANAGALNQGQRAVALGSLAGTNTQGEYAVAIGNFAAPNNQASHSIVISAVGSALENTTPNSLKIAPIRNTSGNDGILQYNNTTKEVSYSNTISSSILLSGSIIPATGDGAFTSSFTLGSVTNAWKELYISNGSIIFVDAITQATSSFTIDNEAGQSTVKYTAAITASRYLGDGSELTNLPSTTNWNKNKEYILRNTEQLTFSGDYILEDCALLIEGGVTSSIGNWIPVNLNGDGTITRTSNNTYRIDGPNDDDGDGYLIIKKYFNTETTMSIDYSWSSQDDFGLDRPIYDVSEQEPVEVDTTNRLTGDNIQSQNGTWTINVPANRWVAIGVYSTDSAAGSGSLQLTLPYEPNNNTILYAANKSFKKEGTIFIGGNLLLKDSTIQNNGKISVGGEVILIGNSTIVGNGIII